MTVQLNIPEVKRQMATNKLRNMDLADRSGISRQGVSLILKRGTCSIINAGRLADALEVDAGTIMKEC